MTDPPFGNTPIALERLLSSLLTRSMWLDVRINLRMHSGKQKRQANNTANKYYIAWLTKSGKLTKNKDKLSELEQLYPNQEIIKIIDFFDIDELEQLAVYHDLEFERFAK